MPNQTPTSRILTAFNAWLSIEPLIPKRNRIVYLASLRGSSVCTIATDKRTDGTYRVFRFYDVRRMPWMNERGEPKTTTEISGLLPVTDLNAEPKPGCRMINLDDVHFVEIGDWRWDFTGETEKVYWRNPSGELVHVPRNPDTPEEKPERTFAEVQEEMDSLF